jgi:hypothetical protein
MKYLFMACTLFLVACSSRDEYYYLTHPQALQNAVKNCPEKQSSELSCNQLTNIAITTNDLVFQLQTHPQGFGKKILALQETIAKQKINLQTKADQAELKLIFEKNKRLLEQYLAVVKWLESPES